MAIVQGYNCDKRFVPPKLKVFHLVILEMGGVGKLKDEDYCGRSIAAGNSAQVLLATRYHHLIYLEIQDKSLTLILEIETGLDMSCLDLNPVGDDSKNSSLAAVGTWSDMCVRIYSLPQLDVTKTEDLGGVIHPRSLLICALEGVCFHYSFLHLSLVPLCNWRRPCR